MKLLVIGLDGMDRRLVEGLDMPFLQSLISERTALPIREDGWSRGWVKIFSGLPAEETGAFYEQPALDGSYRFTQAYSTLDYPKDRGRLPLWDQLQKLGLRSGYFNLPTTIPAVEVDGFMVSGAGGGYSPSGRIPAVACFPSEIEKSLNYSDAIWENRFKVSGIRSADLYVEKSIQAVWGRAKAFVELSQRYGPLDFGFLVHKEPVLVANIFMADIISLLEIGRPVAAIHFLLKRFFDKLDLSIQFVTERLRASHVGIVSDHGSEVYREALNLNAFLVEAGFAVSRSTVRPPVLSPARQAVQKLRATMERVWIPDYRRFLDAQSSPRLPSGPQIDHDKSQAFTNFYVPGIYVNDKRFSRPTVSDSDVDRITEEICFQINQSPVLTEHGITARPYRRLFPNSLHNDRLPDVWVNLPDTIFPEQRGALLHDNPLNRSWYDLTMLPRDIGSGKKSRHALAAFEREFIDEQYLTCESCDLTAAYGCILNHFSQHSAG